MRLGHQADISRRADAEMEALESRRLLSAAVRPIVAPPVVQHPVVAPPIVKQPMVAPPVVKRPAVAPPVVIKQPIETPPSPVPPGWTAQPIVLTNMSRSSPAVAGDISPHGLTPAQIRGAYGVGNIGFNGITGDGTGQTIAIVDAYDDPTALADLNAFSAYFGLPIFNAGTGSPTFTKVNQFGNPVTPTVPGPDPAGPVSGQTVYAGDWEIEEALDIEWAHVIAPEANILLVEASNASGGLFAAIGIARGYAGVDVVSMSWGENEPSLNAEKSNDINFFSTPADHNPVTFLASTGDNGAPGTYPSYSANVVAVGGTTLTVNGDNYASETGWSGSGGGPSHFTAEPGYQNNAGITLGGNFRTIPDVSMESDPNTGVPIYDSYDFSPASPWFPMLVGGTSLATPMWAGLVAIADQGRSLNGVSSLSSAQTLNALYTLPSSDFTDIQTGSNGYQADVGYDMVTGLGTPVAASLVPDLAGFAESTVNSAYFKQDADRVDLDEWINSPTPGLGAPSALYPLAYIAGITFNGASGNDTLTLDYSAGNFATLFASSYEPTYNTGVTFNGSATGNNLLSIVGTSSSDALTTATTVTNVPPSKAPTRDPNGPPSTATTNTVTPTGGLGATPITLNNVQTISFPGGSGGSDTLNINGTPVGGYDVNVDTSIGTPNVTVNVGGSALAVAFAATQHLAGLAIQGAGDVVTLTPSPATYGKALVIGSLSIGGTLAVPTARLDLTNNAMVIDDATANHSATAANVNAWIDAAADVDPNTGHPRWDGNGIASSTLLGASVDLLHSVGIADNATLGLAAHTSFAGQSATQASILVGYALTGDSNLDGTVNILDMQNLMGGYGQQGSWQQGDFNHDGQVNILDVQQIDQNYGQTLS